MLMCDYHLHDPYSPCPFRGKCFDSRLVEHKLDGQNEKREFRGMSQERMKPISELKQPSSRQTETVSGKQGIARESKDKKKTPTGPASPYRPALSPRHDRSFVEPYTPSNKRARHTTSFVEDGTPRAKKICQSDAASRRSRT